MQINPLGNEITTGELADAAVTAAKLGTGVLALHKIDSTTGSASDTFGTSYSDIGTLSASVTTTVTCTLVIMGACCFETDTMKDMSMRITDDTATDTEAEFTGEPYGQEGTTYVGAPVHLLAVKTGQTAGTHAFKLQAKLSGAGTLTSDAKGNYIIIMAFKE